MYLRTTFAVRKHPNGHYVCALLPIIYILVLEFGSLPTLYVMWCLLDNVPMFWGTCVPHNMKSLSSRLLFYAIVSPNIWNHQINSSNFHARQVYFCPFCLPYVYSNIEFLKKKAIKHSIVISFCYCLFAIIFILKIWEFWDKKLFYILRKRYLWHS
jgi:hypothetical protein